MKMTKAQGFKPSSMVSSSIKSTRCGPSWSRFSLPAGALSLGSGGGRSDALGLLDDARIRYQKPNCWEKFHYKNLGNDIMNDLMKDWEISANRPQGLDLTSREISAEKNQEFKRKMEDMKSKTTMVKIHSYPFNSYEPGLDFEHWQEITTLRVDSIQRT